MKLRSAVFALSLAVLASVFCSQIAEAKSKKKVLVVTVTKGFRHDSIPIGEKVLESLGRLSGSWETDFARTDEDLQVKMTREALKNYHAVIFNNTSGVLPLPEPEALLDYVRNGGGFAAMHAGSDTFRTWPGSTEPVSRYIQMLGGEFAGHGHQCAVTAKMEDPNHPAINPLYQAGKNPRPATWPELDLKINSQAQGTAWNVFDEIYLLKNIDRPNLRVLLWMDVHPPDGAANAGQPGEYLVSWVKKYGKGKVFYTILGHRQEVWRDPLYQEHLHGGIRFVLGLDKGSTEPTPVRSAQ